MLDVDYAAMSGLENLADELPKGYIHTEYKQWCMKNADLVRAAFHMTSCSLIKFHLLWSLLQLLKLEQKGGNISSSDLLDEVAKGNGAVGNIFDEFIENPGKGPEAKDEDKAKGVIFSNTLQE